MIKLTLFNDSDVIVNADLIEMVEKTPDTLLTLSTGKKVLVQESADDVINKVVTYRRLVSKQNKVLGPRTRSALKAEYRGAA